MNVKKIGVLVAIGLLIAGCQPQGSDQKLGEALSRIDQLEQQQVTLKATVDRQEKTIRTLTGDVVMDSLYDVAFLTPGADGYSVVRFDLGYLTVKLDNIIPYASGSKVVLQIGNTLSATVNGLKATVEWGKKADDGSTVADDDHRKDVTLNQALKPGSWTYAPIVLDGVRPSDLDFVRLKDVSHTGIALVKRRG